MELCRRLGCATLMLVLMTGAALAGARVGVVSALDPAAQLVAPDGNSRPLALGADIGVGDKIVTDAQGRAEILLLDQSSLSIGPNSEMAIDAFTYQPADGSGKLTARAEAGLLRYAGGALSKNEGSVKLLTPTTLLGVRGGIALISVIPNGATRATFLYGDVLTVGTPNGDTVRIARPGYFSVVAGRGAGPTPPAEADVAELAAEIASLRTKSASARGGVRVPGGTAATLAALKKAALRNLPDEPDGSFDLVEVLGYSSQARSLPANSQAAPSQLNFGFTNQVIGHGSGGEPGVGVNLGH